MNNSSQKLAKGILIGGIVAMTIALIIGFWPMFEDYHCGSIWFPWRGPCSSLRPQGPFLISVLLALGAVMAIIASFVVRSTMPSPSVDVQPISPPLAPGWYYDPFGQMAKRWWDGARWTENTRA